MPTIPTISTLRPARRVPRLWIAPRRGGPAALGVVALVAVSVAACAVVPRPALRDGTSVLTGLPGQSRQAPSRALGAPGGQAPAGQQDQRESVSGTTGAAGASDAAKVVPAAQPAAQANSQAGGQNGASAGSAQQGSQTASSPQTLPPLPPSGRMVIKNGALVLQVSDLADTMQRVNTAVAGIPGAYVSASSATYRADTDASASGAPQQPVGRTLPPVPPRPSPVPNQTATVTIKVPVDSFGDLLQRLRDLGKPLQDNVTTQEVTDEYVDLDAQVRNLEATEQQYQQLLARAQKIEEILPIQQRLSDVRSQIERLRGRMNLLQRQADLSTLTVTLVLPSRADTASGEPRVVRTLQGALGNLGAMLQVALDALIYVAVYALPLVPFALAYWWWRRGHRPPAGPTSAPTGGAM